MNDLSYGTEFKDLYLKWLRSNIDEYRINADTFRITLPFLDRNNDHTELYILDQHDGTFLLTDDGAVINDLQFSGFDLFSSDRRKKILASIAASHGVSIAENNEMQVRCTLNDLPLKKHMLAQCMVKVSDMFYFSKSNVQSLFLEDVQSFLDSNNIRYVSDILVTGKSKLTTHYDFVVGKSKDAGERLIKVVNNMDVSTAKGIIFSWNDTKEMRQPETMLYAFIQDTNRKIPGDAIGALKQYGIQPALWSKRDSFIPALVA